MLLQLRRRHQSGFFVVSQKKTPGFVPTRVQRLLCFALIHRLFARQWHVFQFCCSRWILWNGNCRSSVDGVKKSPIMLNHVTGDVHAIEIYHIKKSKTVDFFHVVDRMVLSVSAFQTLPTNTGTGTVSGLPRMFSSSPHYSCLVLHAQTNVQWIIYLGAQRGGRRENVPWFSLSSKFVRDYVDGLCSIHATVWTSWSPRWLR